MPGPVNLVKAKLTEVNLKNGNEISGHLVTVQFNPETLKVSFANQIQTSQAANDQRGDPARQHVGAGTTKLALQLWFDVNAPQEGNDPASDVRKMTEKVAYFITPKEQPEGSNKFIPPGVRFIWGSFQFDGLMESLEESLEFFSSEGIPLRASMSMNLTQQKIDKYKFPETRTPPSKRPPPGTRPLTPAPSGSTVQGLASGQGSGSSPGSGSSQGTAGDWQATAVANGIENPRQLQVGQLLDLNAKTGASAGIGGAVPLWNDLGASANLSQASLEKE